MSEVTNQPARVGIRELRQNLSVYLERVRAGETLEVTDHGRPVANLEPIRPVELTGLALLEAEGAITPARSDHRTLPAPPSIPGRPLSEILQEMRDEDPR
ncbi:MAG TPA: type II toxin-antitoxin system prevent-host-death family antitoxin [Candidatus Limnocylindrales bacterium]|nr:type II toxin-antitoxin system prevent-host-death family antitoxin [Candidatus Limnocylindrales bacterium]